MQVSPTDYRTQPITTAASVRSTSLQEGERRTGRRYARPPPAGETEPVCNTHEGRGASCVFFNPRTFSRRHYEG
jgi:hypothetical protein